MKVLRGASKLYRQELHSSYRLFVTNQMEVTANIASNKHVSGSARRSLSGYAARLARYCMYCTVLIAFAGGTALFYSFARARSVGRSQRARGAITRATIHSGARLLFRILQTTRLVRVIEEDRRPSCRGSREVGVVVANHPSMLDAMFFLSRYPQLVCVMKADLLRLPIIRGLARDAGYLPYHETPELWRRAKEAIEDGAAILIFPEGTRSPEGGLGEFKRGAARIATELGLPLMPYTLEMTPVVLGRQLPWWRPPGETVELRVKGLPLLASNGLAGDATSEQRIEYNRRESVRLTESLEVLIHSSLSSSQFKT